jgi:tetratricopeptide (TPR) repeat protein
MVMGLVLHHKGELSAARDAQENAVRRFRALGDSTFLPGALVNLGWIEENEGTLDSAETRMRESVAIRRAHLDANDPLLLNSLGALADILRRQDAIEEGTAVAAEALALAESVYPHDHPRRLGLAALHASFVAPGDLDHVERFNRDALSADSLAYGGRSAVVASRLNRLGMLLFDGRGDARGAEPLFREAASVYGELRGSTNVQTLAIETSLATVLFAQGRMTEAASIFERTIPLLETARGTADESLALPLLNLGVIRIAFGRFEDAESLLRRAVAIERAEQSAGDLRIARAEAGLGAALVGLARYVEAEPLLLTAYEQLTRDPGPFDPYPRFTADALAALYTRMGRPADAQRYQRQR